MGTRSTQWVTRRTSPPRLLRFTLLLQTVRFQVLRFHTVPSALAFLVFMIGACGTGRPICADEPMEKFAEALRDRGYFDVAIDYLDKVNPAVLSSASLQNRPLEQAKTYRQAATAARDLRKADALLSAAGAAIQAYRPANPSPQRDFETAKFRGDILFNRARISKLQASSQRLSETQRTDAADQTRTLLNDSKTQYATATAALATVLKNYRIDPQDDSSKTQLSRLRAQYTYLKTRGPTIGELLADTLPAGSEARSTLLQQTANDANSVWQKYQSYTPALDCCLTAARCYAQLDQQQKALQLAEEIFAWPRNQVPAATQREASFIAAQAWRTTEPYPWESVVAQFEPAIKRLTAEETAHPQWQTVRLELARALHLKADELSGQKDVASKRAAKATSKAAIELAKSAAAAPGDIREQALALLQQWDSGAAVPPVATPAAATPAKSFTDAESRGKAILQDVESLARELATAAGRVRSAASPASKEQAQKTRNDLNRQLQDRADAALAFFDQAIRLADASTTRPQINNLRYLQCYCYFAKQYYVESSVIAEFLLEKYPNVSGTRRATSILLRNYAVLLDRAGDNKSFERNQLVRACQRVLTRYPDTTESITAAAKLARLSLLDGSYDQAQTYFNRIPAGDPQRSSLAISLGRRLWYDWSRSKSGNTNDPRIVAAKQYLTEGVNGSEAATLTYSAAEGALLLTEALLAMGEVDAAIQRLESEAIAPLKLAESAHPALVAAGKANLFHQETAVTAIKAYMAAMRRSSDNQQQWIDKTGQVIAKLQQRLQAGENSAGTKRLTTIYRLISQRLIEQFGSLAAGQPRVAFAGSLAKLLSAIEQQSKDAPTVVWAGSTLLSVANTLKQDGATDQAAPIFAQAVAALDRAQSLGFGEGKQAAAMSRELKRQRALAERGAGNYDAAIAQFTALLTAVAGDLNTQLDAAQTLHQQAAAAASVDGFAKAILGSGPVMNPKTKRKQNAIWGWRKLVQATRGKDRYADAFYRSLYHMIEARYQMGRINQSSDGVRKALSELKNWQQRNPDFDNGPWKQKFAQLQQRIETQ